MRLKLWVILLGSMTTIGGGMYWVAPGRSMMPLHTQGPSLSAPGEAGDFGGNTRYLPPSRQTTTEAIEEGTRLQSPKPSSLHVDKDPLLSAPVELDADLPVIDLDASVVADLMASPEVVTHDSRPRIAVVPFRILGKVPAWLRKDANEIIAEQFVSAIDTDRYTLIERSQIAKIVEEKHLQLSDLVDSATVASEVGLLAGVRFLVIGSLSRLEWHYVLTARVVDCQGGGEIHGRGKIIFRSIDQMPRQMDRLVKMLGLRVGDTTSLAEAPPVFPPAPPESQVPQVLPPALSPALPGASWDMTDNRLINATNPDATFSLDLQTLPNQREFVEGDKMSFVVRTTRRCFVTLLSVDPQGNISVLFPNQWPHGREDFIDVGVSRQIPPSEAGFEFLASAPHGETLVKAIGTLRPLRLEGMVTKGSNSSLFQNLGNIKDLNAKGLLADMATSKEMMFSLSDTTKGANAGTRSGCEGRKMLDALYSHAGWTSTQLVIVTHPQKLSSSPQKTPAALSGPLASSIPRGDANEQVFTRWKQLSKNLLNRSLPHTGTLLRVGKTPSGVLPASRELLVFYKPKANETQQGSGTSWGGGGRMVVHTIHAENTAKGLDPVSLQSRIDQLEAAPDVAAVIPNYQFTLYSKNQIMPATYYASVQWALRNDFNKGVDTAWHRVADRVRSITPSLIAVVDQGCDVNDPRLAPALWTNSHEIFNNGLDDDHNGQIDDIHGYNFVAKTASLLSGGNKLHHGSFISSIIAGQVTGAANDVIGLVPQARILTAVAIGPDGTGDLNAILTAINYAVRNGAKVINLSLGSSVSRADLAKLAALPLWDELEKKSVMLVCAAGNANKDNDQTPVFPASLPRSNVIAVMAVDSAGMPARGRNKAGQWVPFSNYGRQSVHLAAPGSQILGIPARGQVTISDGTSFAASMVVATVALVQGLHPQWDHRTVKRAILESTRPLDSLAGRCTTGGLLDVQKALDWKP